MKKKLAVILTVALLISAMLGSSAMACGRPDFSQKNYRTAVALVDDCNSVVELMVLCAQLTPYNDVPVLLRSVDALIWQTTYMVNCLGFDTECEYREYRIDGQKVMIDPLRVINPLDEPTEE